MRRASIVIASLNEGLSLRRTVESCLGTIGDLDCEILVADDDSRDGSLEAVTRDYPQVRVVAHRARRGVAPTKHLGARSASGGVLVFLDGHCKPEPGAIRRLVEDVEALEGRAVVTPAVPALDPERWENQPSQVGYGYWMELTEFRCGWASPAVLRRRGKFYESPALIGCCLAIDRSLYAELGGFDEGMQRWGAEDIDFGLKAWFLGSLVLNDPDAVVGHRFRTTFDNYELGAVDPLANQLRMARKHFSDEVWSEWLSGCRCRHEAWPDLWAEACALFGAGRESLDAERRHLVDHRTRDEFWYAEYFDLPWPRRA